MGGKGKKAIDKTGLSKRTQKSLEKGGLYREKEQYGKGVWNEPTVSASPEFDAASTEKVYSNGNSWIVIGGQDRLGPKEAGGGGSRGHTGTDKIDIVVGRQSSAPDVNTIAAPNPFTDAARIYISQRTDIDNNFGIDREDPPQRKRLVGRKREANPFDGSTQRSAAAIKADAVRLIGRESIKIVTGKAKDYPGGPAGETNSQGGKIRHVGHIDLIAGNNIQPGRKTNTLQPMVLGENLVAAIDGLTKIIEDVQSATLNFMREQEKLNNKMATHIHTGNLGAPTTPSPGLIARWATVKPKTVLARADLVAVKYNVISYRVKHLTPSFPGWICSRGCRLT
jgi:hypothetical protein